MFTSGSAHTPRLFWAKYDGYCYANGCEIMAGERIGYDENDKLCCEDCLSEDSPQPLPTPSRTKTPKPCKQCHLAHVGDCF